MSCSATHDTPTQNQVVYESFSTGFSTKLRCLLGVGSGARSSAPRSSHVGSPHRRRPRASRLSQADRRVRRYGIVTSRRDSDLEAFSHNPADGSFAPLAPQPSARTKCLNLRFLSY
ncbi:senescence associated [Labeo rohita]|uniref:Senescence associated n=1 Tax=Labeo rohita TaxID=84645 RepID=A0A498P3V2_LABRO|nr:senescence associated [Labeo rohita]